jgi:hypothetical protein
MEILLTIRQDVRLEMYLEKAKYNKEKEKIIIYEFYLLDYSPKPTD